MNHVNKFFLVVILISPAFSFAMQQQVIANAALLAQLRYQHLRNAGIIMGEPVVDQSARRSSKKHQPHYETKQRNQPHSTNRQLFSQHHK